MIVHLLTIANYFFKVLVQKRWYLSVDIAVLYLHRFM